jgi:serine/threonine-protein kinase
MVFGTPEFMSPEQAQGKSLTPASDVYSLAVILYEVLTGKLPFDAKSAMDYISLHVTGKPIPISQRVPGKTFPPLLDQIMERALAKRSEDRYASAAEFGAALQHVLSGAAQLPSHLMQSPTLEAPTSPMAFTPPAAPPPQLPALPQGVTPPPAAAVNGTTPHAGPIAITPTPTPAAAPRPARTNVALLVGVAVGFLLLGVGLALALSKLMSR